MDQVPESSAIVGAIGAEQRLLQHEVRTDRSAVEVLLDPEFTEIGQSGRVWARDEMLNAISSFESSTSVNVKMTDPRVCILAPGLVHLTYISHSATQNVRRSSIWRASESGWRIVFHQGTPMLTVGAETGAAMRIHTHEQLLCLLDQVIANSTRGDRTSPGAADFWAEILTREGHPLATNDPDENLADWHTRGLLGELHGRRVLDIGCGAGRNSRWFAEQGAIVHGIDIASGLLDSARPAMPSTVALTLCDVLRDRLPSESYDVIYDSGCFHHLAPHRRETYLHRVLPALARGGRFGIVAFAAGSMGSAATDLEIITSGEVEGGIGYSCEDLRMIFSTLEPIELRAQNPDVRGAFSKDFLNAGLFGSQEELTL